MAPKRRKNNTRAVAVERYVYQLQKRFGLSVADFVAMGVKQGWCCAVCGRSREELQQDLVVDHCHATGRVRGLLCRACNQALGLLRDDPRAIKRMLAYLEFSEICAVDNQLPNDV